MNFYTKVLARRVGDPKLKLRVSFEVSADDGKGDLTADEIRTALRELGLDESVELRG